MLLSLGCTNITWGSPKPVGATDEREIGDASLLASDLALLAEALLKIPNETLDYESWITLTIAAKAACGGDEDFFANIYAPWALRYHGNTEDVVRDKWDSVTSARIGASYVFSVARHHGFSDTSVLDDHPQVSPEQEARDDAKEARKKLPLIRIEPGNAPAAIDAAEQALIKAGGIFRRGSTIVRPARVEITVADQKQTNGLSLVRVGSALMADLMTRAARFEEYKYKAWRPANFPRDLAQCYVERVGEWKLPILAGTITGPTLRPDGSILRDPGYDVATGLLFEADGTEFPLIPENPTRDDALEAAAILERELLGGFPFVADTDKAVALSTILTAVIRRSLPTAPLHAFSAPVAGSGKSLLVDIAASIAEGRQAAVIAPGKTEEELEKRLGAASIAGHTIIAIDNIEQPLGGEQLCMMLTQPFGRIRVMGQSKLVELPFNSMLTATGNNLSLRGDMGRRVMLCRLDPKEERPETRTFPHNPLDLIRKNKGRYLVAALTILRAFHLAGRPRQVQPLGSFEVWSDWVRGAIMWLGKGDPCANAEQIRADDPELTALRGVMQCWAACFGQKAVTTKELLEPGDSFDDARRAAELQEAFAAICGDRGQLNGKRLGHYLSKIAGRVVNGRRILKLGENRDGVQRWKLEEINNSGKVL